MDVNDKIRVSKVPYNLLSIPENTTFEALSPELTYNSEGLSRGILLVSCSGPDLLSFDL